jgi:hypothetical protein
MVSSDIQRPHEELWLSKPSLYRMGQYIHHCLLWLEPAEIIPLRGGSLSGDYLASTAPPCRKERSTSAAGC